MSIANIVKMGVCGGLVAAILAACGDEPAKTSAPKSEEAIPADVPVDKSDGDARIDIKEPPAPVAE